MSSWVSLRPPPNQRLCGIRRSPTKRSCRSYNEFSRRPIAGGGAPIDDTAARRVAEAQAHAPLRSRPLALPAARCRRGRRCECGGRAGGGAGRFPRVPGLVWRGARRWRCGPASASTESGPGARRALSSRRRELAVQDRITTSLPRCVSCGRCACSGGSRAPGYSPAPAARRAHSQQHVPRVDRRAPGRVPAWRSRRSSGRLTARLARCALAD